jgi:hypothetical protein
LDPCLLLVLQERTDLAMKQVTDLDFPGALDLVEDCIQRLCLQADTAGEAAERLRRPTSVRLFAIARFTSGYGVRGDPRSTYRACDVLGHCRTPSVPLHAPPG